MWRCRLHEKMDEMVNADERVSEYKVNSRREA